MAQRHIHTFIQEDRPENLLERLFGLASKFSPQGFGAQLGEPAGKYVLAYRLGKAVVLEQLQQRRVIQLVQTG